MRGLIVVASVLAGCGVDGLGGGQTGVTSGLGGAGTDDAGATAETTAGTAGVPTMGSIADDGSGSRGGGARFDLGAMTDLRPPSSMTPSIPETCAQAEAGVSTVGCTFFGVDLDTHDENEDVQFAIVVSNVQPEREASVVVELRDGAGWQVVAGPVEVAALDLRVFELPAFHQDDSGVKVGGAYRITSDTPIIAYQFNPIDGSSSFYSDASMLYPVPTWDTVNHVVGWGASEEGPVVHGAYATVIAAEDGTLVEVTPRVDTLGGEGVPAGSAAQPFTVTLDAGDLAEIMTKTVDEGLTGTKITSNHPVAVMSGHECANIPANICCCDHLEEQLSGVRLWGRHFIGSRFPSRPDSTAEQTYWQIYAAEDDTEIIVHADDEVSGVPREPLTLAQGEVVDFYTDSANGSVGDFEVESSHPIAVAGYMTGATSAEPFSLQGDPAMVQMSPVEQFLPRYVVLVPGTWENDYLVITRPLGAEILIDGAAADDLAFVPVADSDYEVGRVRVSDGVHVLDGGDAAFQVVVVGFDTADSFGYLGGAGTEVINPNPQG